MLLNRLTGNTTHPREEENFSNYVLQDRTTLSKIKPRAIEWNAQNRRQTEMKLSFDTIAVRDVELFASIPDRSDSLD